MIKCDMGKLEIRGGKRLVAAELKTILAAVRQEKFFSEKEIDEIIEESKLSEEELQKRALEHLQKLGNMVDLLSKVVNKDVDEDIIEKFLRECEKDE